VLAKLINKNNHLIEIEKSRWDALPLPSTRDTKSD